MLNKFKGVVTIQVRDCNSHELINEHVLNNVFTDFGTYIAFWQSSANLGQFNIGLRASTRLMTPEMATTQTWSYISMGATPSGYNHTTWVDSTATQDMYVDIMNRFTPPGSSITINNITLSSPPWGYYGVTIPVAHVNLPVPLIQTTSQYLDIYYRIYIPASNTAMSNVAMSNVAYRTIAMQIAGQPIYNMSNGPLAAWQILPFPVTMPYNLKNKNGRQVDTNWDWRSAGNGYNFNGWRTNQAQGTVSQTWNNDYFNDIQSYNFTTTDNSVGTIFNNMIAGIQAINASPHNSFQIPIATFPITKNSKIQNIFRHSSKSTTTPFLDVSNIATSTGNVIPSGTTVIDALPEMYFINMHTGGPVGTATYTYTKRKILNLYQGTYQYIGSPILDLTCDDEYLNTYDPVNPQLTLMTTPSDYTHLISGSKPIDTHTFVLMFSDHVITHDILKGQSTMYSAALYPTFLATSIQQIAYDGLGNLFVACSVTGLYMINIITNTITVFGVSQLIPSGGCFGVHIGQSPSSGVSKIWAVFNGDVAYATSMTNYQTWNFYNATTPVAFNIAGISDSNWNTVSFIVVDKNTDNMLLIRLPTTTILPLMSCVWWSPVTVATGFNFITNPVGTIFPDYRTHQNFINVSDNNSFWCVNVNGQYYQLFFNSAAYMLIGPYVRPLQDYTEVGTFFINFEYDYINKTDVLLTLWGNQNVNNGVPISRSITANYLYASNNVSIFLAPLDGTIFNGNIAYDSTGNSTLVTANAITTVNSSPFSGGSSISFNGTSSYIAFNAPLLSHMPFGSAWSWPLTTTPAGTILQGAATIECWIFTTAAQPQNFATIFSNQQTYTTGSVALYINTGNTLFIDWPGGPTLTVTTASFSNNVWHHIAVVITNYTAVGGAACTLYLDGINVASMPILASHTPFNLSWSNFNIGGNSWAGSSNFTGYITDFKVMPFAAYTANFALPTSKFTSLPFLPPVISTTYANFDTCMYNQNYDYNSGYFSPASANGANSWPDQRPNVNSADRYAWIKLERGNYVCCQTISPDAIHANVCVMTSVISGLTLDNTKLGGNLAIFSEYQYGWNGTMWELGNTVPAITTTTNVPLENGLQILFQDSATPSTSFTAGDYFNFAVLDGILKDGQSTLSYSTTAYLKQTISNSSDFGIITGNSAIISSSQLQLAANYRVSNGVTINSSNQVILTGIPGDYAVLNQLFTGNFDIFVDFTTLPTNSNINGAKVGIGIGKRMLYYFAIDSSGIQYMLYRHYDNWSIGSPIIPNGYPLASQAKPITSMEFIRTGYGSGTSTISMLINGTIVHSETDAQYTNGNVYQFMFRTYQAVPNTITMGTTTIKSADANPPLAILGSSTNMTGHYDPFMWAFDIGTANAYTNLTLNGTPVTASHTNFITAPAPGEISMDQCGAIRCNPADVGKTLSGNYFYLYDSGII